MGLDLSKINAGVTEVGRIVQQGVSTWDAIAQRVTNPFGQASAPAPTPTTPTVTTQPAAAPGIPKWLLIGGGIVALVLLARRGG